MDLTWVSSKAFTRAVSNFTPRNKMLERSLHKFVTYQFDAYMTTARARSVVSARRIFVASALLPTLRVNGLSQDAE